MIKKLSLLILVIFHFWTFFYFFTKLRKKIGFRKSIKKSFKITVFVAMLKFATLPGTAQATEIQAVQSSNIEQIVQIIEDHSKIEDIDNQVPGEYKANKHGFLPPQTPQFLPKTGELTATKNNRFDPPNPGGSGGGGGDLPGNKTIISKKIKPRIRNVPYDFNVSDSSDTDDDKRDEIICVMCADGKMAYIKISQIELKFHHYLDLLTEQELKSFGLSRRKCKQFSDLSLVDRKEYLAKNPIPEQATDLIIQRLKARLTDSSKQIIYVPGYLGKEKNKSATEGTVIIDQRFTTSKTGNKEKEWLVMFRDRANQELRTFAKIKEDILRELIRSGFHLFP